MAVMYIDPPSVGTSTTGTSAPSSSGADKSQQSMAMNQTKLRESLQKAGFEDIKIVDATYLVDARTSDGSRALMHINPASATSGSGQMAPSGSSGTSQQSK
jgi:hypothetical protein